MKVVLSRFAWILFILGFATYSQQLPAQEEVVACCSCGEPQFDMDCNFTCPDSPWCQCGTPYCSQDGSGWVCPQAPSCAPGYEPACLYGQWACSYAGNSGGGGASCAPYCNCPWFDAYCQMCPYYDPFCEYCDYEWDPYCYDCDSCDPSCGSYFLSYWSCNL